MLRRRCTPAPSTTGCGVTTCLTGRETWLTAASGALDDDDRDLARGARLVLVVGRPDLGHDRPERRPLRLRGGAGARLEAVRHHLHLDLGLGHQVLVPGRMLRRPAARGHHQVAIAVAAVDQRRGPRLAGAPAGGRQEQRGHALPDVPVLAAALAIAARVLLLPARWPAPRRRAHGEPPASVCHAIGRAATRPPAHHVTTPPSMFTDWPVMNAAAGEHRNAMSPATSSSEAARPIGMRSSCRCHPSLRPSTSMRAVSMVPGHTALTVTP